MNKVEFIARLSGALSHLPPQEREDILNDYEEHFRISAEMGKSEEETAQGLGSPEELGATYVEGEPLESPADPGVGVQEPAETNPQTAQSGTIPDFGFPVTGAAADTETAEPVASSGAGPENPFAPPRMEEAPRAPQPEEYGDPWDVREAAPEEAQSSQQVPPQGYPYEQTGYHPGDQQSCGYYDSQGYFHPDGGYPQQPVYANPAVSRSGGEQVLYTVLLLLLTIFIVLPVGGGLAVALWGVIFCVAVAAGVAALALFLFNFFNVGVVLLGAAALCLCVAAFLGLISYTMGVIKLFISYFKMCGRVISGRKEEAR